MSLPFWPKLIKLFKLLAGDDDSNVRLIILHIPFSLALLRLSLSVLSKSSRFSKASLSTARYIVPVAYYNSVTQDAVPVSYYSWKSRFSYGFPYKTIRPRPLQVALNQQDPTSHSLFSINGQLVQNLPHAVLMPFVVTGYQKRTKYPLNPVQLNSPEIFYD